MSINKRCARVPGVSIGAGVLVCCSLLLASCDGPSVVLTDANSPSENLLGTADSQSANGGDAATAEGFGDEYWAELAQSYPAYVPEPGLGAAHGPEDNIVLGRWGDVIDFPLIATGAANLPDGKLLTWSSTQVNNFGGEDEFTHGIIFDPVALTFEQANNDAHNAFCAGVSLLADGSVFAAGGGATITTTSLYDDGEWSVTDDMRTPRWYPTSTTLASGQVLVTLGTELNGESELWTDGVGFETAFKLDLSTVLSDDTAQFGTSSWYPTVSVAPDGTLFHPGPVNQMLSLDLHTDNGVTHHGDRENDDFHRLYNSTVMYDVGKLLLAGGGTPSVATAMIIDINGGVPLVTPTNPMNFARALQNSIVLPNGEVLSVGGNTSGITFSDEGTVVTPEIWNPDTQQWTTLAPHTYPRNYHSTAMLLKDARVISMGGGLCGGCQTNHQNGEIFEPPYLFNSDGTLAERPVITETDESVRPGDTMVLSGSDDIAEFSLLRLAALTHHHTTDQRRIPLPFNNTGAGTYELTLPENANVLIPGNYWLFALNSDGVPSTGYSVVVEVVEDNITNISELNADTGLLTYEYFENTAANAWTALPDFDALTPVETGFATSFSLTQAQQDDHFGFRYEGRMQIEEAGEYEFFLASDDGSRLYIDDQLVIDHDGLHAATEETANHFLSAGVHDVRVEYFENDRGHALIVEVAGDSLPRQSITSLLMPVSAANAGAETLVEYEYFEGSWNSLPDFDALIPVKSGIQSDFSIAAADNSDNFAFRYTTRLLAETPGNYTFFTGSDDGSQVFVNDTLVVDNDGLHPVVESSGSINLPIGWHDVVVTFFEKSGGEALKVDIQRPNSTRQAFDTYADSTPNGSNNGNNNNGNNNNASNGGNQNTAITGVSYEYFEGNWNVLPNFDALTPVQTGNIATLSLQPAQVDDFFGFRFSFNIEVETAGQYTFHSVSDDGSQVWVNGQQVVDNNGLHPPIEKSGITTLTAGTHQVVVNFFEKAGGQVLQVDVTNPSGVRANINNYLPADSDSTPAAPIEGVDYQYFEGNWNALPNFDALTPVQTGNAGTLSLQPALLEDFFGFRFRFSIEVATAGQYTFHSTSDDGSQVRVNGQLIVDNDGLHPPIEVSGTTSLTAGTHEVVVDFFEKAGGEVMQLDITNPAGVRAGINTYLFQPTEPDVIDPDATDSDAADADTAQPAAIDELIDNGDFEADLAGWRNCGVEASSSVLDVATGGSQLMVASGGCQFQELPVEVGDTLILACDTSNDGTGFSSFALTLQDDAFVPLLTTEVSIPAGGLQRQSTALVVPQGVTMAVITLYSEALSAYDNCSLTINQ